MKALPGKPLLWAKQWGLVTGFGGGPIPSIPLQPAPPFRFFAGLFWVRAVKPVLRVISRAIHA